MFEAVKIIARELEKRYQEEKVPMKGGKIVRLDDFLKPSSKVKKEEKEEKPVQREEKVEVPVKPIFVRKPRGIVVYVDSRELRSGVPKHLRELGGRCGSQDS